jgi:hypothetical protein
MPAGGIGTDGGVSGTGLRGGLGIGRRSEQRLQAAEDGGDGLRRR